MLAPPEERRAIKDSRGKCRSRVAGRMADIPRPVQHRDKVGSLLKPGLPRTNYGRKCGHGQVADAVAVTARTGHGLTVAVDMSAAFARTVCGFSATISRTQNPRFGEE